MPDFIFDRRDIEFVLYEQLDLEKLCELDRYAEMNKETADLILGEGLKLAVETMSPANAVGDREGTKLIDGSVFLPKAYHEVYAKFVEGGWVAPSADPEFGGMGLPIPLGIALAEMFLGACSAFMFLPGLTASGAHLIEEHASDELKQLFVEKMYTGQWTGTMCLTEPQAGTAVGDVTTVATPIDGSDRYKISGNKIFISEGDQDITENIIHLVLARIPGDAPGTKGISLFAVPKRRINDDGSLGDLNDVTVTAIEHKMGINASPTCALAFGEKDACEGWLIGEPSQGIVYMFQMMNEARLTTGLQGVSSANASYQLALAYAKERVQGTRLTDRSEAPENVTIIEHPDVRRNLLLCKSYSEGIRALLLTTALYADYARNHRDKGERAKYQGLLDLLTPICKAYATDVGFRVTELAMQIHGGYGYVGEYGVEQYMRDVKIASIYEGTNGVQALDLMGRKMRLKGGGLFMAWMQDRNELLNGAKDHERLADVVKLVDDAKNVLGEVAFGMPARGKKDPEQALLGATPFLEIFGQVQVASLLLEQALIADAKLQGLAEDHPDHAFYDGKIKSARFFALTVLPHAKALAAEVNAGDRSALDIRF